MCGEYYINNGYGVGILDAVPNNMVQGRRTACIGAKIRTEQLQEGNVGPVVEQWVIFQRRVGKDRQIWGCVVRVGD